MKIDKIREKCPQAEIFSVNNCGHGLEQIIKLRCDRVPFAEIPKGNEDAKWVLPELICMVEYMNRTENGGYRQPVFKGIRAFEL